MWSSLCFKRPLFLLCPHTSTCHLSHYNCWASRKLFLFFQQVIFFCWTHDLNWVQQLYTSTSTSCASRQVERVGAEATSGGGEPFASFELWLLASLVRWNFTAAKADLTGGLLPPQHQLGLPLPLPELVLAFVQVRSEPSNSGNWYRWTLTNSYQNGMLVFSQISTSTLPTALRQDWRRWKAGQRSPWPREEGESSGSRQPAIRLRSHRALFPWVPEKNRNYFSHRPLGMSLCKWLLESICQWTEFLRSSNPAVRSTSAIAMFLCLSPPGRLSPPSEVPLLHGGSVNTSSRGPAWSLGRPS